MFLVDKTHHLTSPFRSFAKKSTTHTHKSYQQPARFFDEKVLLHLKTLTPPSDSSIIALSWLSKAVSFLSIAHSEAHLQISSLGSESDYHQALYMSYSMKVLDLCNLISSAVHQLTERRLLMNLGLRLLNSSGQIPSPDKLRKAKDALTRSVHQTRDASKEKGKSAKALIEELTSAINNSLPIGKTSSAKDLIRRTLHGLGLLTVFIASVLVAVLYGRSDLVEVRVPAEFLWADSVNRLQTQIFDLIKPKQEGWLLELNDTASRAKTVCDAVDEVVFAGDGDRSRLEDVVKELRNAAAEFSEVVDGLTNGVNGLFNSVLKTRNGVLDGVRKATW